MARRSRRRSGTTGADRRLLAEGARAGPSGSAGGVSGGAVADRLVGSWRRMHECVGRFFGPEGFEAAAIRRQEDLLVYFALGHFGRWQPYKRWIEWG